MPMSVPAEASRRVSATSSADGSGSPEGWLWKRIERGRARDHRLLEDLARMHQARGEAADRDHRLALQPVAHVEGQQAERLDRPRAVARQQVARGLRRRAERRRAARPSEARRAPSSSAASDARGLGPAQPAFALQLGSERPARPRSPRVEERVGHVERGGAARARAQHEGQQLAVRERARRRAAPAARAADPRRAGRAGAGGPQPGSASPVRVTALRRPPRARAPATPRVPRSETSASAVSGVASGLTSTTKAPAGARHLRQRGRGIDEGRGPDHEHDLGLPRRLERLRATAASDSASPNHTTSGRSSAPHAQRGGTSGSGTRRSSASVPAGRAAQAPEACRAARPCGGCPPRACRPSTFCVASRNSGVRVLERGQRVVGGVGGQGGDELAPPGVPLPDQPRVAREGLRGGQVLRPVLPPEAARARGRWARRSPRRRRPR